LLEGKNVNLRIVEREDLPLMSEWLNSPSILGEYEPIEQESRTDIEKRYEEFGSDKVWFLITKKDGSIVGNFGMGVMGSCWEIGYVLIPDERGKGYCTEAVQIAVDYLFMSKDIVRIQAKTHLGNVASQKVLEKSRFKKEGTLRKEHFVRGEWRDRYLYSILREEWKEPKILTRI
jgi:ribosomal-protein-alanine N-acetyltransferase